MTVLILLFTNIIPQIIREIGQFITGAPRIAAQIQEFTDEIQRILNVDLGLNQIVGEIINTQNLETIGQTTL